MGITQHRSGTANVQQMMNLLLLRGNVGRAGAGIAPIRGHSNVQGDRTVGITEIPSTALLDGVERAFGFRPPARFGHNAVDAGKAIMEGSARAIVCLGGNFAVAMSDPRAIQDGMRRLDLAVHLATKLNRTHLMAARETFILPVLGRTELDVQASGPQSVTVEDSVSMVHASRGLLKPASDQLRSEPAVVAGIAKATIGHRFAIDWDGLVADYDRIRDKIETVFPDFKDYNARIRHPGGFLLDVPAARREWRTPSRKANFLLMDGLCEDPRARESGALTLTTLRAHDQYNTTIYGLNDRYRGIFGRRDVLFMNEADLAARGLAHGDLVELEAMPPIGEAPAQGAALTLTAIAYDVPKGCVAAYYPEANVLIPLAHHDPESGTPSYKSMPVRVRRAA
jgi:molybdopterin-dependent oxidoreductase alpha subunit